jgi:hypothetical protein
MCAWSEYMHVHKDVIIEYKMKKKSYTLIYSYVRFPNCLYILICRFHIWLRTYCCRYPHNLIFNKHIFHSRQMINLRQK